MSVTGVQQLQSEGMPLHATWWQVLKPSLVVMANGQPGYEIFASAQTLAEATNAVRPIPGGVIVMNVAVFVNPRAAPASAIIRKQ